VAECRRERHEKFRRHLPSHAQPTHAPLQGNHRAERTCIGENLKRQRVQLVSEREDLHYAMTIAQRAEQPILVRGYRTLTPKMNAKVVAPESPAKPGEFAFIKAGVNVIAPASGDAFDWSGAAGKTREGLSEAINARNVAFLLGSGCSSLVKDGVELGISTMGPLAKEFVKTVGKGRDKLFANATERAVLKNAFGIELTDAAYANNLERLMETLLSLRFGLQRSIHGRHKRPLQKVESVIGKLQRFILEKCSAGAFAKGDRSVAELYESFYRKLIFRDRALPRPWIFTTNYDLFNETAMDRLGLPNCNGFSGTVERRFNPAVFRYSLAEQLDLANRKWTAVDGFVYLCKLHGSINWIEDEHGLSHIRETQAPGEHDRIMIFPTPTKQSASLGSPYSDLFREFQSRVVREQSVLFVIGYSFGDEHVNNIIFQALTIPTFKLIIFASPDASGEIAKLKALCDPRVWLIGGDGPDAKRSAHFFDTFVEQFMPQLPNDRIDTAVSKVLTTLLRSKTTEASEAP